MRGTTNPGNGRPPADPVANAIIKKEKKIKVNLSWSLDDVTSSLNQGTEIFSHAGSSLSLKVFQHPAASFAV
jgi:hypothetical protein